jgi:hypothetical protein
VRGIPRGLHSWATRVPVYGVGEELLKKVMHISLPLRCAAAWARRVKTRHFGCGSTATVNVDEWCGLVVVLNGCGVTERTWSGACLGRPCAILHGI